MPAVILLLHMHRRPQHRTAATKRIAVVVPKYGLVGGSEKFVFELTERIAQDPRWEIHVFANRWRRGSDAIQFHCVPIVRFPRFAGPLSFAASAGRKIRRLGVDLVHTHERIFDAHVYSVHGIPHAIWAKQIRGKGRLSLFDHMVAYIERKLVENTNCRHLLAVSGITAEKLQEAFGNLSDRLSITPPGIDLAPFSRWSRQHCRSALLKQFGWTDDDRILLFAGMNFEIKGLDWVLKALSRLHSQDAPSPVRLLVVGKGNISKYKGIADSLGVGDRVAFMGRVENNVERVYMGSDVFILLSRFDTFGIVVLEAMAAALPVIISPTVGARDIVNNGENGYVVDPSATHQVCHRIEQALDPTRYEKMSRNAYITATQHSWSTLSQKVIRLYAQCLNPDAGSLKEKGGPD